MRTIHDDTGANDEGRPTLAEREAEQDAALDVLAALLAEGEAIRARIAVLTASMLKPAELWS